MDAEDICEAGAAVGTVGAENEVFAFLVEDEDAGDHLGRYGEEWIERWEREWKEVYGRERTIRLPVAAVIELESECLCLCDLELARRWVYGVHRGGDVRCTWSGSELHEYGGAWETCKATCKLSIEVARFRVFTNLLLT